MRPAGSCAAMKWALFFVLLLLRFLPCGEPQSTVPATIEAPSLLNKTNGSTCAQWLYGTEPPLVEDFQCVVKRTGIEVKFCCGTCGQPSNCYFEKLLEGTPARPTDGGLELRPPSPPHLDRLTWFWGGVVANAIFYWAFIRTCRRFWRRKRITRERPVEGLELDISSSGRLSEHRDPSDASTRLVPPSSEGGEGPAAASGSAPSVQPQAGGSENVTIMWYPTGFVPLRIGPTPPSQPKRGGKKRRAKAKK